MPIIIETKAYAFDELSDEAKEKARQWYRETRYGDASDFECVIDDFVTIAEIIGVSFSTHNVTTYGGKTYQAPNIWWSGFCSQGDGACFEGEYRYKADATAKIREHCSDEELLRITDALADVQMRNLFGLVATIEHRDRYYHEHSVSIDVRDARRDDISGPFEAEVAELMRDLMRWLYKSLDDQNDYIESDEYADEALIANEHMFDEEGDNL